MSDAIVTEGISKKYGNITALDGVTLSVPSGMLFGLIGPDGITVKSGRPSDICPKGSLSIPI